MLLLVRGERLPTLHLVTSWGSTLCNRDCWWQDGELMLGRKAEWHSRQERNVAHYVGPTEGHVDGLKVCERCLARWRWEAAELDGMLQATGQLYGVPG